MCNTGMHKKQKLSPIVSLSNSYSTKKRKHGFVNLCNESTMKCTDVVNPGELPFLVYISSNLFCLKKYISITNIFIARYLELNF